MSNNSTIMDGNPPANIAASTIETVDAAFYEYVESLNINCTTNNGWKPIPIIWASAERAFQVKNNVELRDSNGSLIPPIISVERISVVKSPTNKGSFQANLSPADDRYFVTKILNQDKTSNFANADSLKRSRQINFVTSKRNNKIVYQNYKVRIPVYITVEYKINILTSYQSQMNEAVEPFMARTAQNYFVIKKDSHRYECFMDQNFTQENISNLGDAERKYKTAITVKVLGYLIGEGNNEEQQSAEIVENAVELKLPKENIVLTGEPIPKNKRVISSGLGNFSTPASSNIAVKKVYLIGNGVDSSYNVLHNLNTRDIFVLVRENFGPSYSIVTVAIDYSDLNYITVNMGDPIPEDSYSVIIIG